MVWHGPYENTNCNGNAVGEMIDGLPVDDQTLESCKQLCEDTHNCNCIVFFEGSCWRRRDCDVDSCSTYTGAVTLTS